MAINLDFKVGNKFTKPEVNYDLELPEGTYLAELVSVYKWREITKDTKDYVRDADGNRIKGDDGRYMTMDVKNVTWYMTDILLRVSGGDFDGAAIKGTLSTHPMFMNNLKGFLTSANIKDPIKDLFKHDGAKVMVAVKPTERSYTDKNTGLERTITENTALFYNRPTDTDTALFNI